ncbi:MAG: transglutaminase domain-containing protein [Planctomycetota bacterium]|nr:MAG: transglutaminase domain-containing protein [Planctomycetota bacterium]
MKKLTIITLLLVVFSYKLAAEQAQDFAEFVRNVKKKITIERSYKIETEEELVLAPGQAARLNFMNNPAGVAEIIFFYDNETVHFIFGYTYDTEKKYDGTELNSERKKSFRGISASRAAPPLWIFYGFEPKDDKASVNFRATESFSEKDQEQIKEIEEMRERRNAAKLRAISELEWDYEEKIKPLKIIMDDANDPNMIRLRKKYDVEGLVSKAADDYEKLRLITRWAQKQWKHSGDNKPSRSDPLTILKEASEGKRFRCVEYAKVVAGCARSLGMPSRTLGLKRLDVETAESGAGHVVAEVWLDQFNKWVFVDGQYGAIAEVNGDPLNAVEFQEAIAHENPGLRMRFATKGDEKSYLVWVAPYLYYFDFNLDQRFYKAETEEERLSGSKGKIMLVPKGAKKPKVFQRKLPIENCTYISNPKAFYPQMNR